MQIMPMPDPVAVIVGMMIFMALIALYLGALVSILLGPRARKQGRRQGVFVARALAIAAFLFGIFFVTLYSRLTWSTPRILLTLGWILVALGVVAWLANGSAVTGRQRRIELLSGLTLVAIAAGIVIYDIRTRERRDAFIAAVRRGDAATVRKLLDDGVSASQKDEMGFSLLLAAPNLSTVDLLLRGGANLRDAPAILHHAAERGDMALANYLLQRNVDPNVGMGDISPARRAFWRKDAPMLEMLRKAGAKDAEKFQRATGALLRAVDARDVAAVRAAASAEVLMEEQKEAFRRAAANGDTEIAMIIARITSPYAEIGDAAILAARNGHIATMQTLLDEMDSRKPGFVGREKREEAEAIAAGMHP